MVTDNTPQGSGGQSRSLWGYEAVVNLPARTSTPLRELLRRAATAGIILLIVTTLVYLDNGSYSDNTNGDGMTLIDSLYYATITITTTGYGDVTPVSQRARLVNVLVFTPLRIGFLVLLVGTTLEVLANEGRRAMRDAKWRKRMRNHTVILGYGTTGRSAFATLMRHGGDLERIVVIDQKAGPIAQANRDGLAAFHGNATSRELLRRAEISKAREVIITVNRDDTAILATLTVRQLNPSANIVVAVNQEDNETLVRQSGANAIVPSSDAVGRLVGLSSVSPNLGSMMEDLLSYGEGLEVAQRQCTPDEVGKSPHDIVGEKVIGVVRNQVLRRFFDPSVEHLQTGDDLIVVRPAQPGKAPVESRRTS